MKEKIHLIILGNPKALKRHRMFRKGNTLIAVDPSKGDKADFLTIIRDKAPKKPFDCPLEIKMFFYFSRPKNHYRAGKYAGQLKPHIPKFHTIRPDVDNLIKFVADSLTGIFYYDDTLISVVEGWKLYDEKPRTEIIIKELENE